jgi:hypothetical protein
MAADGLDVKAQVGTRPIGVLLGLNATANPFAFCASMGELAFHAPAFLDQYLQQWLEFLHKAHRCMEHLEDLVQNSHLLLDSD